MTIHAPYILDDLTVAGLEMDTFPQRTVAFILAGRGIIDASRLFGMWEERVRIDNGVEDPRVINARHNIRLQLYGAIR